MFKFNFSSDLGFALSMLFAAILAFALMKGVEDKSQPQEQNTKQETNVEIVYSDDVSSEEP